MVFVGNPWGIQTICLVQREAVPSARRIDLCPDQAQGESIYVQTSEQSGRGIGAE